MQTAATADSAATGWSFGYDANGALQSATTRSGEVRQYSADNRGRVLSVTRAAGTALALQGQITWHPAFRLPTQSTRRGVTHSFTVDGAGRVTTISRSAGGSTSVLRSKVYNNQNLLSSTAEARGATTSYSYDGSGNVSTVTDPLGNITTYSNYTPHGQAGRIQHPDGTVVTRAFDARFRLSTRTVAGVTTQYAYDAAGRLGKVTAADGSWRSFSYDTGGYLTTIGNDRAETTSITRDSTGTITKRSTYIAAGALPRVSARTLNAVGHVSAVVDSRNYATHFLYGSDGRLSGATDALGLTRYQALDVLNRKTAVTVPNTSAMRSAGGAATVTVVHTYDSLANHTATPDTNAVATGHAYDGVIRRTGESGADAGSKGVVRNAAGDVTSFTDPRGVTMTVNYDAGGRMTANLFAGATDRTYTYVPGRSDNLLAAMTDGISSSAWTYDSAGRVLTQKQTVYSVQRTVTVARDTLGRPTSITYSSGLVVGVSYAADVVSAISINGTTLLSNVSYFPQSGIATGWRWGNGTGYSRTLDADGRVTSVSLGSVQRGFGFDAAGKIVTQTDTGSFGTRQSTFAYDEAGQVINYSPATGSGQSFAYDTNGNRRSQVVNGVASTSSYAANSHRLTSWYGGSMQYSADGSPSTGPGGSYYYDSYGRLGSVTNSSNQAFYNYNGLGQRILKRRNVYTDCGVALVVKPVGKSNAAVPAPEAAACNHWPTVNTLRYVYDFHGHLIGEYDSVTGYSQETVWFNGQPVATVQAGKVYSINADHLGTPRSIVRATDNVELWRWDSDPFGTALPTAPNPASGSLVYNLRFPGQLYDSETGFHYNGMRDYMPSTGRYLEAAPIGLAGGLSRYAYADVSSTSKCNDGL